MAIWSSGYNFLQWDLVLLLLRGLYVGVLIGAQGTSQLLQLTYGLIVLICTSVFNVGLQPWVYHHKHLFFFLEVSLLIVAISHSMNVHYVYSVPGASWLDYCITVAFVGLNGGFMALIVFLLVSSVSVTPILVTSKHRNKEEPSVPNNSINSSISLN